jgi:hypothetical protein
MSTPRPTGGTEPDRSARFAERVRVDVERLCELYDQGIEVDGDARLAGASKWVIYGRSTYDGEIILAEYDDQAEAEAVIRSLPPRVTGGT